MSLGINVLVKALQEISPALENDFNIEDFSLTLNETVNFKPKGHTHENWMGV